MMIGSQVREDTIGGWTKRRISIILTIIALALLSYSITQARLNIGFFGLIHSFPIVFFVALGIILIASGILWTSPQSEAGLLITQLLLLNASLWLAPLLVGSTVATSPWIYEWAGFTEYVVRTGHFAQGITLQYNWPAAFILYAAIVNILGLPSPGVLIQPAPFAFQLAFLVLLYPFLRYVTGHDRPNLAFAGLFVFSLANWGPQTYLSAQSLAYAALLVLLILLSRGLFGHGMSVGWRIVGVMVGGFITVTHVVTSLVAMAVAFVLSIRTRGGNLLALIIFVFIASWAIYVTTAFLEAQLSTYLKAALDWLTVFREGIVEPATAGDASRQAVSLVKIVASAMFWGMALAGLLYSWKRRQDTNIAKWMAILLFSVGGASLIVGGSYTWELLDRFYLFALPFMVYFTVKLVNSKLSPLLLVLLLVAIPLFFVGHYGSQITYHVSHYQFAAADFFEKHTDKGELITWDNTGGEKNIEQYYRFSFIRLRDDDSILYRQPTHFPRRYVEIGEYEERKMGFLYSDRQFVTDIRQFLATSPRYNLIYTNPEVDLFVTEK